MRSFLLTVFICCIGEARAFLPNAFSAITDNDYTHEDITELGILAAVAKFFEDNPVNTCKNSCTAGSLTGIADITARKLYDAVYNGEVSEKRFEEAIVDLVKQNNNVDQDHADEAEWHFNGEQIREGHSKMQLLRETALQILNGSNPSYDAAREVIGQYLHLLQMFYSNTNWVELGGNIIHTPLGITGETIMPVAPQIFDTCKSCGQSLHTSCTSNILVSGSLLTSGYRSGQNVAKPSKDPSTFTAGKCSHGGPRDLSSTKQAALGGINKDSMDPSYSPHSHLHEKAAKAAIEHTRFFFADPKVGLISLVGNDVFQRLLELGPGDSLVFVVDTSASMRKDIEAVQNKTAEIIIEQGAVHAPHNYILVLFNGPANKTTIQETTDLNDIQTWLGNIVPQGGGGVSCKGFSLTGLQAALNVAMPGSEVFVFTDINPNEPNRMGSITSLISEKKLRVKFVITSTCAGRRRHAKRMSWTFASLKLSSNGGLNRLPSL